MTELSVVGGGVIGLAIAWRCAQRGMRVTVHDDQRPGASSVAAGLLAPASETYFGESDLTGLLVASAGQWPAFAAELESYGDPGYRTDGTLVVALTADDLAEASRLWSYQESLGFPVTRLSAAELRSREAALHPRVRGGAFSADHQADPRKLLAALRGAALAEGARIVRASLPSVSTLDADTVVVAAGCGSAALTGLPVRQVKGQLLRLRAPDGGEPGFRHVIRGWADRRSVYLVPRTGGEVVVGATEEERTDAVPTAGAVLELLRAATDLVPELTEYELAEVCVGHRPGTPDNAPILGTLADGTVVATGHYRHGILLAPVTADTITELVATGKPPDLIAPFTPTRFASRDDHGVVGRVGGRVAQEVHDRHEGDA